MGNARCCWGRLGCGPWLLALLGLCEPVANSSNAHAGPAIGQFELKSLEAGPGYVEFQSLNAWSRAGPGVEAQTGQDGDVVTDGNTAFRQRHALEIEYGFSEYLKMRLGVEFERERIEEPVSIWAADRYAALAFDEVGMEVIGIAIPRKGDGFGLGAVVEWERPVESGAMQGVMLGPILEFASGPWFISLMPAMVHHFAGSAEAGIKDRKWDFTYAAQLAWALGPSWTVAVEAFGTIDRVAGTGERGEATLLYGDHDQHRVGPVLYYELDLGRSLHPWQRKDETSKMEIGVGYLAGLNANTPDGTLKLSIEVEF